MKSTLQKIELMINTLFLEPHPQILFIFKLVVLNPNRQPWLEGHHFGLWVARLQLYVMCRLWLVDDLETSVMLHKYIKHIDLWMTIIHDKV